MTESPVPTLPTAAVVLTAAVAGLLFAPVFGLPALLLPIGVLAAAMFAAALLSSGRASLEPWRPLLIVLAGLLAIAESVLWATTLGGLPTGETVRALASGVTDSWQLTLQSTWPARPDAALLLFVPLLVLLAGVLGIELLHRLSSPLPALAPSLAVVVLSQLYTALSDMAAVLAALAYAAAAGALLAATRVDPATDRERRWAPALLRAAPPVVLAVTCAVLAGVLAPAASPRYSLKQDQVVPLAETRVNSPLDEVAHRLTHPGKPVFEVSDADGVDRWTMVVLDEFDGVNWTPDGQYRRLGTKLSPAPMVDVDVEPRKARIDPIELDGPWLPSQPLPAGVGELDALVEEQHGTLIARAADGAPYTLTWWEPQAAPEDLLDASINELPPGELGGVGEVPPEVAELANDVVQGKRATFQSALVLQRFLRENYQVATGQRLPTGHSWSHLSDFLLRTKRGTSEQFAAAYVVMARILGIPARLAVGFRSPAERKPGGPYTVRNGDVLAWPEVAVEDVGWVPLDPSGAAVTSTGDATGSGLASAAAQAGAALPPPDQLRDPPVAPGEQEAGGSESSGIAIPVGVLVGVPLLVLLAWLIGVPSATAVRTWRRRRREGTGAIVGAWEEVRDRLRAHGVPVSPGMTVRDLASATIGVGDQGTVDGVRTLGSTVDMALWSGAQSREQPGREAWSAVRTVRKGLARRGWRARLRAALDPRILRPPRG